MKSYQFFTEDGRGGTMLCDDESLEAAVAELKIRFPGVVKVQIGTEVWEAGKEASVSETADAATNPNQQALTDSSGE